MNIIELLTEKEKRHIKYINLKKSQTLFFENDLCLDIGIMISGEVTIKSYLNDGKEIIYNILKKGDIFGNNLIFSSNPYYKGNIIASTDCEIGLISKEDLLYIFNKNETFLKEYLKIQSNFSKSLNNRIKLLSIDSAKERLLFYLHENKNEINFDSITSLAAELYLSRESLSRTISKLKKDRYIIKDKKIIRLI